MSYTPQSQLQIPPSPTQRQPPPPHSQAGKISRTPTMTTQMLDRTATFSDVVHKVEEPEQLPPQDADCMRLLWEQMLDNDRQRKALMMKFMTQIGDLQGKGKGRNKLEMGQSKGPCPPDCHGHNLVAATGLQQVAGVNVPWCPQLQPQHQTAFSQQALKQNYQVESEPRRMMEEQKLIKNTWVQFLNIFDMALDLANDLSRERSEANMRRKERARLEREEQLAEEREAAAAARREREQERKREREADRDSQQGEKSSLRPSKDDTKVSQDDKKYIKNEKNPSNKTEDRTSVPEIRGYSEDTNQEDKRASRVKNEDEKKDSKYLPEEGNKESRVTNESVTGPNQDVNKEDNKNEMLENRESNERVTGSNQDVSKEDNKKEMLEGETV